MPRADLQNRLDAVAARVPAMRDEYPDRDELLQVLAGELDLIEDAATEPSDARYVSQYVDLLLAEAGVA
ncbi:hypothetical protein [Pseudoxanthomonas winnipegensis]|uniref:Uncharacterized protein n=1 Tax=Pseudoxanthomonas winnipegensis TaxID=2480810 RepID=A0A4Q8M6C7_9GAMM|nr:hypothetical protein [Pseudoxanthomonas winnipegensis]TAA45630.1 hypothetical protein EA655_05435 [Pseudoxanthomonas winnipegensis]